MTGEGVTLLDGAMGTELRMRGVEVPDHITSIWSAKALLDAPEVVVAIHRDYIDAGARVITANNYMVTPPLLARAGLEDRLEELAVRSVELAERARDAAGRPVRIAASLPPLSTSYRAEMVGDDAEILADYRRLAEILAPRVDLLLCETMSSAREGAAAATAASETGREAWLSWTLQGDRPDRLPSGETLEEAFTAADGLGIAAFLVNCCAANFVTRAVPILRRLTELPVGGYANSVNVVPADGTASGIAPEQLPSEPLDVDRYAAAAAQWIEGGATLVGGCCSTSPAHIARIQRLIDEGPSGLPSKSAARSAG
jgi:S-methylmethionine-dependent homocysteine/selenocysteine methylase